MPEVRTREIQGASRRWLGARVRAGSLKRCGMVGEGNGGHIWDSRSGPAGAATIADNITITRSVDHTQVEVGPRMSMAAMGKIGKAVWWSLSLGPILSAQGLDHLVARLLAYAYPVPA
jgi:hypothetical protein